MLDLPHFDELVKLAQDDPEALEQLRQQHVNELINNAPASDQKRLRGMQFQIDAQRQIHNGSPMGSCMKISQMMHESLAELRSWLNQISDVNDPLRGFAEEYEPKENKVADIISFPSS